MKPGKQDPQNPSSPKDVTAEIFDPVFQWHPMSSILISVRMDQLILSRLKALGS